MQSLRRTLAVRFALTMLVALALIACGAVVAGRAVVLRDLGTVGIASEIATRTAGNITRDVLWLAAFTLALATAATLVGAGWLARRTFQPLRDIARQAREVTPGITGQRITAHATVAEFHELVDVVNAMLSQLDRGVESQRRLIADAGHDLKTPLTAMRGELEVALRSERSPQAYRSVLTSVLDDVEHLSAISESLLTVARLDAGELTPRLGPLDVDGLLSEAAARWRDRLDGRPIDVSLPVPPPAAQADARLLELALDQLLDNVARHTPPGTRVTLAARATPDSLLITVDDDGPGQAPEVLPHLFDRFYRRDAARTRGGAPSAGLGLTVVQAILAVHGGSATAARGPRGGLAVTLSLPGDTTGRL